MSIQTEFKTIYELIFVFEDFLRTSGHNPKSKQVVMVCKM